MEVKLGRRRELIQINTNEHSETNARMQAYLIRTGEKREIKMTIFGVQ